VAEYVQLRGVKAELAASRTLVFEHCFADEQGDGEVAPLNIAQLV
jgi:hypothetical protein